MGDRAHGPDVQICHKHTGDRVEDAVGVEADRGGDQRRCGGSPEAGRGARGAGCGPEPHAGPRPRGRLHRQRRAYGGACGPAIDKEHVLLRSELHRNADTCIRISKSHVKCRQRVAKFPIFGTISDIEKFPSPYLCVGI